MKSLDELRAAISGILYDADNEEDVKDKILDLIRTLLREDLMGLTELRQRLGIKSSAANMRTWRGSAPTPAGRIANGRIWLRPDVEDWIRENPKAVRHHDLEEAS